MVMCLLPYREHLGKENGEKSPFFLLFFLLDVIRLTKRVDIKKISVIIKVQKQKKEKELKK